MPLVWKRGKNPYVFTYYGILQLGPHDADPNFRAKQVIDRAKAFSKRLAAGKTVELAGRPVDDHSIQDAKNMLGESDPRAHELLLAHPQPPPDGNAKAATQYRDRLIKAAVVPEEAGLPCLVHPLALLWFTPAPGPATVTPPDWDDFDLGRPGDAEDRAHDIVFDS